MQMLHLLAAEKISITCWKNVFSNSYISSHINNITLWAANNVSNKLYQPHTCKPHTNNVTKEFLLHAMDKKEASPCTFSSILFCQSWQILLIIILDAAQKSRDEWKIKKIFSYIVYY